MKTLQIPLSDVGLMMAAHIPSRHWKWCGLMRWDPLIEREPMLIDHLIRLTNTAQSLWDVLPAGIPFDSPKQYFLNLLEDSSPQTIEAVYRCYLIAKGQVPVDKRVNMP